MNPSVSIVIIGRNEESTIGNCLEAAIAAAHEIGGAEIVYIDSYSTDNTVREVQSFGVEVKMLDRSLRRSPSSARYFGTKQISGEFVLFLDADTLVYPGFLPAALTELRNDETLAGINGRIDDTTETGEPVDGVEEYHDEAAYVSWLRGPCCLYRRSALIDSGGFDPELATEEEAELGLRIIQKGWKLKVIPIPMAKHTRCYHPTSVGSLVSTFLRDLRSGRLGEITRTIVHASRAGNGPAFCWLRLHTTVLFLAWCVAIVIPALFFQGTIGIAGAALIAAAGASAVGVKKRSLSQAILFVPAKLANVIDILLGLNKVIIAGSPRRDNGA